MPNIKQSALINPPSPQYRSTRCLWIQLPIQGSRLICLFFQAILPNVQRYQERKPIPSWEALMWLVEDYSYLVEEDYPQNKQYGVVSLNWHVNPSLAVLMNGNFCHCPRRHTWNPTSMIDLVEYNWPRIPGQFNNVVRCAKSYQLFHQQHINHTNPVCFLAAVFCDFFHHMCVKYGMVIDVNPFNQMQLEFHILFKIKYQSSQWLRLVEIMAITHFSMAYICPSSTNLLQ